MNIEIFLRNIRIYEEMDQNKNEAENLNDQKNREENDDLIISIQEMIEDARARRHHKVSKFSCEQ